MEKIDIKRLSDEIKPQTATEFMMSRDIITNSTQQIIMKINELVDGYNEIMKMMKGGRDAQNENRDV